MPKVFFISTDLILPDRVFERTMDSFQCREVWISNLAFRAAHVREQVIGSRVSLGLELVGDRVMRFVPELEQLFNVKVTSEVVGHRTVFGTRKETTAIIDGSHTPFGLAATYWNILVLRACLTTHGSIVDGCKNVAELLQNSITHWEMWNRQSDKQAAMSAWARVPVRTKTFPLGCSPTDREMLRFSCGPVSYYRVKKTEYRKELHEAGYVY